METVLAHEIAHKERRHFLKTYYSLIEKHNAQRKLAVIGSIAAGVAAASNNANVNIHQIIDLLGHSSVSVTQKAYAHLQQNTLRSASEVVVKELGDTLGEW